MYLATQDSNLSTQGFKVMDSDKNNDKQIDPSVDSKNLRVKSAKDYTPNSLVTLAELAKLWGLDRETAEKYIAEMESNGLTHAKVPGTHRRYHFRDVQKHLEAIKQTA